MKDRTSEKNKQGQLWFYLTIATVIFALAFIFFGERANSVGVDEMLKHVHTGDAPF